MKTVKEIAESLKARIAASPFTQEAFANYLCVSHRTLSRQINDESDSFSNIRNLNFLHNQFSQFVERHKQNGNLDLFDAEMQTGANIYTLFLELEGYAFNETHILNPQQKAVLFYIIKHAALHVVEMDDAKGLPNWEWNTATNKMIIDKLLEMVRSDLRNEEKARLKAGPQE